MQNTHLHEMGEQNEILVSAEVIAKKLSVSSRAVLLWAKSGQIPCVRIGGKTVRFSVREVMNSVKGGAA